MSNTTNHINQVMQISVIEELMWDNLKMLPASVKDRFFGHFSKIIFAKGPNVSSQDTREFIGDIKAVLKNSRFSALLTKDFVLDHCTRFLEIKNVGAFVDFLKVLKESNHPVANEIHQNLITEAAEIASRQCKDEAFEDLVKLVADDKRLVQGILPTHVSLRSTSLLYEREYNGFIYFYDTMTKAGLLPPHYNDHGIDTIARSLLTISNSAGRDDVFNDTDFQSFADFAYKLNLASVTSPLRELLLPALRSQFQTVARQAAYTKDYGILCDLLDAAQETGDYSFIDLVGRENLQNAVKDLFARKNYSAVAKLLDACSKSKQHSDLLTEENHTYVVRRSKILAPNEKTPEMDVIVSLVPDYNEVNIYIGRTEFRGVNSLRANWDSGVGRTNAAEIVIGVLREVAKLPTHPAYGLAQQELRNAHPKLFVRR
jgi:hypothetical protein